MGNDGGPVTLKDLIYEMRLVPFVLDAWRRIDGSPGMQGCIQQLSRVYKAAEADMEEITGERRRLPRVIDIPAFTQISMTDGSP
ncbi:MAG: hypothetical protein Gyms2KO_28130 [Gymnodinialimonas sp.]